MPLLWQLSCGGGAINLSSTVANGAPDLKPTKEINANMSAIEMLTAAVDNYYGADFALARTTGSLTTEVMSMKLTQFVKSITIRDGASDADNKLYYQNQSGTVKDGGILGNAINIRIWEETDYVKSGDSVNMYFRSANSDALTAQKLTNAEGVITDTWFEWNGGAADFTATQSYNSLDTYIEERSSDPTRIWMYDINENTILNDKTVAPKSTTEKLSDGSEIEYYTFSVSGNVDKNRAAMSTRTAPAIPLKSTKSRCSICSRVKVKTPMSSTSPRSRSKFRCGPTASSDRSKSPRVTT